MTVAPPQTDFYNVINIETRRLARVVTGPELAQYTPPPDAKVRLRKWAQSVLSQLDYLMSDAEAWACAAADVAYVRELRGEPEPADSWARDLASWAAAAREPREKVTLREPELSRLRALLADDDILLERTWRELSKPPPDPTSTLQAAEFLVLTGDVQRMRRWLSRHSAAERKAILRHLKQRKKKGQGNGEGD